MKKKKKKMKQKKMILYVGCMDGEEMQFFFSDRDTLVLTTPENGWKFLITQHLLTL